MGMNILWWVRWHPMTMGDPHAIHHYDESQVKYFADKDMADEFMKEIRKIMPDGRWVFVQYDFVWRHHYPDVEVIE